MSKAFPEYVPIKLEEQQPTKVVWTQVHQVDENGEVVREYGFTPRLAKNRGGFVIAYTQAMSEFLEREQQGSVVRLFLYIAQHQDYGTNGVYGFRTTRSYLAKVLSLTRKTVYTALEYLKSKYLVNELRINGSLEFMVNPDYVTIGADRRGRDREWNERWIFYNKHVDSLSENRNSYSTPRRDTPSVDTSSKGDGFART